MRTWIPVDFSVDAAPVTIDDADAILSVNVSYDEGSFDADGRRCYPAFHYIEEAYLDTIHINGKARSRDWLIDLCGREAVEAAEELASENLDAAQLSRDAHENYAAE